MGVVRGRENAYPNKYNYFIVLRNALIERIQNTSNKHSMFSTDLVELAVKYLETFAVVLRPERVGKRQRQRQRRHLVEK